MNPVWTLLARPNCLEVENDGLGLENGRTPLELLRPLIGRKKELGTLSGGRQTGKNYEKNRNCELSFHGTLLLSVVPR